jgi:hypothetical protein
MTDAGAILTRYLQLVGDHDLAPLTDLFSDDLVATTGSGTYTSSEWIAALDRLLPVLVRNDLRRAFVDGKDACAIYDFVTDTAAGAVPCVEWITIDDAGRIVALTLIFEKANWSHVVAALQERAATR